MLVTWVTVVAATAGTGLVWSSPEYEESYCGLNSGGLTVVAYFPVPHLDCV